MENTKAAKNKRSIVDYCLDIFAKENKPLHVSKILNQLKVRRWRTNGKTPTQTIASKLNKDYRFVRVAPNTFKLEDDYCKNRRRLLKK